MLILGHKYFKSEVTSSIFFANFSVCLVFLATFPNSMEHDEGNVLFKITLSVLMSVITRSLNLVFNRRSSEPDFKHKLLELISISSQVSVPVLQERRRRLPHPLSPHAHPRGSAPLLPGTGN